MKYNPQIHHRRSIRLKGYDYTQAGAYFITICCQGNQCRFGFIKNGEMVLNEYGQIAYNEWIELPDRFINFELDVFQIMPNHMHGIIVLSDTARVGAGLAPAQNPSPALNPLNDINVGGAGVNPARTSDDEIGGANGAGASPAPTGIGNIIGTYKSLVANGCLEIYKSNNEPMGKLWHRNYYEHIIRNEESYQNISNYILDNPMKWNEDAFFIP